MKQKWMILGIVGLFGCIEQSADIDDTADAPGAQVAAPRGAAPATWTTAGNGLDNTHNQPLEKTVGPANVGTLGSAWSFQTKGDIWGTPAVDETTVYLPDSAGNLFALDRATGAQRWTHRISDYTGHPNDYARTTPAIAGNALFLGNQIGRSLDVGPTVIAVDKTTGAKLWATKVDDHPAAIVTSSPVVHGQYVYVGVSSWEEFRAPGPYKCCSFRGSVVALNRTTGAIAWKTYMTPGAAEAPGYTGVGVWGSTPVVDVARGSLYVTTGNNYSVPTAMLDCQALPTPEQVATCVSEVPGAEHNYFDSVLALDLNNGKVKWVHHAATFDSFNGACLLPGSPECTNPRGPDADFGQGAILYETVVGGRKRQLLGAGQKSGVFWALNPDNGQVVWKTLVGPGGVFGGLEWGSASDGERIYTAVANSESKPWTLPSGESARSGLWSALDGATGAIVWQTRGTPAVQATNRGAVSVANGVVYGGTYDAAGTMYAFDARTGKTLWTFASGATVNSAPAIVDGTVYWGSGYNAGFGATTGARKLHAFRPGLGRSGPGVPVQPVDAGAPGAGTWSALYATYFGAGTVGHCVNCHADMSTAKNAYAFLAARGQISGAKTMLAGSGSILTWFGGSMPPDGPARYPEAERDIRAWVEAGALNN